MTNHITPRTIMATAFAVTAMALLFFVGGARAGTAGNLHQCDSNDPSYTVQCCETLVRNKEADWIRNSGKGCKALTICTGTYGKYKCYIKQQPKPSTYCQLHPKLCNPPPPPKQPDCSLKPNPCRIKPSKPTTNYCTLHPKACLPNNNQGNQNGGGAENGNNSPGL